MIYRYIISILLLMSSCHSKINSSNLAEESIEINLSKLFKIKHPRLLTNYSIGTLSLCGILDTNHYLFKNYEYNNKKFMYDDMDYEGYVIYLSRNDSIGIEMRGGNSLIVNRVYTNSKKFRTKSGLFIGKKIESIISEDFYIAYLEGPPLILSLSSDEISIIINSEQLNYDYSIIIDMLSDEDTINMKFKYFCEKYLKNNSKITEFMITPKGCN